ncbi:MAG: response regulator [Spirochaetota bacterium]|nr:response regulator [Spirochaetota bacterium]
MSNKKLILIIEDNFETSNILKGIFEDHGFRVKQTYDGLSGLNFVKKNTPDLIVLDIILPDINGLTICKQLKIDNNTNLIPIIMLTGLTDNDNKLTGIRVGADKYITKPFEIDNLLDEVNDLLVWKDKITNLKCKEIINFIFNSEANYLDQLDELISIPLKRTSLSDNEIVEVKTGLFEIVTNAIEWGNNFNKNLFVKIYYELFNEYLTFSIMDQGSGFNCQEYLNKDYHPVEKQDERLNSGKRLGGFGIKIAKAFFDHLKYDYKNKKVILKKNLIYSDIILS